MRKKKKSTNLLTKHGSQRYDSRIKQVGDQDSNIIRVKRVGKDRTWYKGIFREYLDMKERNSIPLLVYEDNIYYFSARNGKLITCYPALDIFIPTSKYLMTDFERLMVTDPKKFITELLKKEDEYYRKDRFNIGFYNYLSSLEEKYKNILVYNNQIIAYNESKVDSLIIPDEFLPISSQLLSPLQTDFMYYPRRIINKNVLYSVDKINKKGVIVRYKKIENNVIEYTIKDENEENTIVLSTNINKLFVLSSEDYDGVSIDNKKKNSQKLKMTDEFLRIKIIKKDNETREDFIINNVKKYEEALNEYFRSCISYRKRKCLLANEKFYNNNMIKNIILYTELKDKLVVHNEYGNGKIISVKEFTNCSVDFGTNKRKIRFPEEFINKIVFFEDDVNNDKIDLITVYQKRNNIIDNFYEECKNDFDMLPEVENVTLKRSIFSYSNTANQVKGTVKKETKNQIEKIEKEITYLNDELLSNYYDIIIRKYEIIRENVLSINKAEYYPKSVENGIGTIQHIDSNSIVVGFDNGVMFKLDTCETLEKSRIDFYPEDFKEVLKSYFISNNIINYLKENHKNFNKKNKSNNSKLEQEVEHIEKEKEEIKQRLRFFSGKMKPNNCRYLNVLYNRENANTISALYKRINIDFIGMIFIDENEGLGRICDFNKDKFTVKYYLSKEKKDYVFPDDIINNNFIFLKKEWRNSINAIKKYYYQYEVLKEKRKKNEMRLNNKDKKVSVWLFLTQEEYEKFEETGYVEGKIVDYDEEKIDNYIWLNKIVNSSFCIQEDYDIKIALENKRIDELRENKIIDNNSDEFIFKNNIYLAWFAYEGKNKKPDLRRSGLAPRNSKMVCLELSISFSDILFYDDVVWNEGLQNGISFKKDFKETMKLFKINKDRYDFYSNLFVRAIFCNLNKEMIKDVKFFTAK